MLNVDFLKNDEKEAILYYLYMMSDGHVTYDEEKLFNSICKNLKFETEERNEIIEYSKKIAEKWVDIYTTFSYTNSKKLDEEGLLDYGIYESEQFYSRIIWNLINLGFADKQYSKEEKFIVDYLSKEWKINQSLLSEMIDTASTLTALVKKKDWVLLTFPPGSERDAREKQIDEDMEKIGQDIKLSLDEINI